MQTAPKTGEFAEAVGISKGYASDILNGKRPTLNRALAIHIFRTTGWRHESIADLTAEQIEVLEAVDPWTPQAERDAA